jgi:hypothetical protein
MEEILKLFNALSDEEKIDVSRAITVAMRGISVPPVNPGPFKFKQRDPNDNDIADMPLDRLQKLAGLDKEDD